MTSDEIRENIRYNENLLDEYHEEKYNIEKELNELEELKQKITTLQNDFGDRQAQRQQGLTMFSTKTISNRIFSNYYEGMKSLLTGNSFNNAYDGLSTANERVDDTIQQRIQSLEDCESRISYTYERKLYWREQLWIAMQNEMQEEV